MLLALGIGNAMAETEVANIVFADSAYAMSTSTSKAGDITEPKVIKTGSLTTTISKSTTSTPNRFWNSSKVPELRVYGGDITLEVPEGKSIRNVTLTFGSSKNANNTFNGEVPETATKWEGNSTNVKYEIAGKTFIKAITATIEDADSETTTYTVTEPEPEPLPVAENIAALKAMESNTEAELKVEKANVTYVSSDKKYQYIEDATGALMLFNYGITLTEGKQVTGSLKGKYTVYNSLPEFVTSDSTANSVYTETVGEQFFLGTEMTIAEAKKSENISKLAILKDLTITKTDGKYYLSNGTETIQIYDKFKVLSDTYAFPTEISQITGIIDNYNGVNQLAPIAQYAIVEKVNIPEVENIAGLAAIENGTTVKLMLNKARVVINRNYNIVISDYTGSVFSNMMSYTALNSLVGAEGNVVNGYITASVTNNNGMYTLGITEEMIDQNVTSTPSEDAVEAKVITTAEAAANVGRYVEIQNADFTQDLYEEYSGTIAQGEDAISMNDQYWLLEAGMPSGKYEFIRGIVSFDGEEYTLWIYGSCGADAYKKAEGSDEPTIVEVSKISDLANLETNTNVKLTVENAKVTVCETKASFFSVLPYAILEDGEAGISLQGADGFDVQTGLIDVLGIDNDSIAISGTIYARYVNEYGKIELQYNEALPASEITKTTGVALDPKTVTIDEIKTNYATITDTRLVKIESPVMGFDEENYMTYLKQGESSIYMMDSFTKLERSEEDGSYTIYEGIDYVTGLVLSAYEDPIYFIPVTFVFKTNAINGINANVRAMGDIYNMNGVKVRNAGEDMKGLQKGMYIMNGKKVILK